jgi:hypothetical protein
MKKKVNYVQNSDLIPAIQEYQTTCKFDDKGKYVKGSGKVSTELAKMITAIITGLSDSPNFRSYT